MARLITVIRAMQAEADALRGAGKRVGVVPTMGALHAGHLALIAAARRRADAVVATVFVNPAQFGPGEDFERYPRDLERDTAQAAAAGADVVFAPAAEEMYPGSYATFVAVERLSEVLEGKARPGHFRGVATVVTKLLHAVKPHVAVFGQKDAQQVAVVRRLLLDLNFDVELVVVPTVRERDGLALSSRNAYLDAAQRREAPALYAALRAGERAAREGVADAGQLRGEMRRVLAAGCPSGVVDYVSVADAETLEELAELRRGARVLLSLAVRLGRTRLIDNVGLDL